MTKKKDKLEAAYIREEKEGTKIVTQGDEQLFLPLEGFNFNEARQGQVTPTSIAHKSNFLAKNPDGYGAVEQDIISMVLGSFTEKDEDLPVIKFSRGQLAEGLRINKNSLYTTYPEIIANLAKTAYEMPVEIDGKLGYMAIPIFKVVGFLDDTFYFMVNDYIKPHVHPKRLWENVGKVVYSNSPRKLEIAKIPVEKQLALAGRYAKKMYQVFSTEQYKLNYRVPVEELRDILNMGQKFIEFKEFNRNVLTPAIKEINDKTDLYVTCKKIKTGQKISDLDFIIVKKSKDSELKKLKEELEFFGISKDSIEYIFETLMISETQIRKNLAYFKKKFKENKINDSSAGWLYTAIIRNYAEKNRHAIKIEQRLVEDKINEIENNSLLISIKEFRLQLAESIKKSFADYINNANIDFQKLLDESVKSSHLNGFEKRTIKLDDLKNINSIDECPIYIIGLLRKHIILSNGWANDLLLYLEKQNIKVSDSYLAENFIQRYVY